MDLNESQKQTLKIAKEDQGEDMPQMKLYGRGG